MHKQIAITYLNFNSNLFNLRDKIHRDLTLKSNLYNIHHRPSRQNGSFSFITQNQQQQQQQKSFSTTSASIATTKRSSYQSSKRHQPNVLKQSLLFSKLNLKRLQTQAIETNNSVFQKRLSKVYSPYSKKKINQSSSRIEYYKSLCRRVKPIKESLKRNNFILYKLPHIYIRNY